MNVRFDKYTAAAADLFNAGFTSKAGQKTALDYVNRAFSEVRDAWHKAQCAAAPHTGLDRALTDAEYQERGDFFYRAGNETPFDLHQVRDRHLATFEAFLPGSAKLVRELIELRATIKSADIVPPAKDETKVRAAKVIESIRAHMERLQVRYLEAIDLCTVFDDGVSIKGLTANSHYVTNEHGTTFLRTFFYIYGKLTPLNVIMAAAEEASRRAKA